jgi:tetratricopeptide (TPR) repeat protein
MKIGHFICILAITVIIAGFIPPVLAAENATTDAATNYYNIGVRYLAAQDYQRAIGFFDQALASNTSMIQKSDGLLYTYQGKAYAQIQLTQYDNAAGTAEQGLTVYPADPMLWNDKGYALFKLGRYQDAVTAYDSAIGFDQNYTSALINKGQALFLLGKYQEASDTYQRAVATDPGNSEATAGLAQAQDAAAAGTQTTLIVLGIVGIAIACVIVWYVKFRKPAPKKVPEKKTRKPKKK